MNVKSILAVKGKGVVTIKPDQTIREAILTMEHHNIGSLVVVDETGQMVGIVTERHIIRLAPKVDRLLSRQISEVMVTHIITVVPQDDLDCLVKTMTEHRVRHLPVLDQGKLIGLVSIGDVLEAQRDEYQGEVTTLETQILAG